MRISPIKVMPWFAVAVLILVAGCQYPGPRFDVRSSAATTGVATNNVLQPISATNQINPEWLRPPVESFTLGPGDRLEIELLDDLGSRTTTTVGPDGKIYFSLLPGVDVWGLTLSQTKELLEREMSKFTREKPGISIVLRGVESKKVWLLGRLLAPGVYSMTNSLSLLEAVFLAGGPLTLANTTANAKDELADLRRSFVLRQGKMLPLDFERLFKGDLSQNIYLEPEDFVYLAPATVDEIHVIGAVAGPRAVPYTRDMSLVMAIANCSGTLNDSYLRQVAVVRGSLNQPKIALVDYKEIIKGRATDVLLEPGDIVYVPYKPYRILTRYMDLIMTTFVSATAINEGARAVLKSPPPTTGILIPFGSSITVSPSAAH